MKKLLILLFLIPILASGQMSEYYKRPTIAGKIDLTNGTGKDMLILVCDTGTAGMLFKTKQNVANGVTLRQAIRSGWMEVTASGGGGGSMIYPGAGIPLSTGSAWGTSITNNSANWNTAYGWGNHASAGYVTGTPWTSMGYVTGTPWTAMGYLTANQSISLGGILSGSGTTSITVSAATGYYMPTTTDQTNWNANNSKVTMTYPGAGYPVSTGSAWGNSISTIQPQFAIGLDSTMINTTMKFPLGYSQGIVIDSIVYLATTTATGGTLSVTPKLYYGSDITLTGTAIVTSPSAITARLYRRSTFDNATIAKGNIIWATFSNVTTIPRNFFIQIIGHKQ